MNKIKFDKKTLEDIFQKIALGNSIKSVLDDKNLSYEGLRKLMRKKPKIRQLYEEAKEDGIDYLLSNTDLIEFPNAIFWNISSSVFLSNLILFILFYI